MAAASNLRTRIITVAAVLPIPLVLFPFGPRLAVAAFLGVCLALCVLEMGLMVIPAFERKLAPLEPEAHSPMPGETAMSRLPLRGYLFPGIAVLLGWAMLGAGVAETSATSVGGIAVASMVALLVGSFSSHTIEVAAARAFGIAISLCYGALPWLVVWQLYSLGSHARYVFLVMAITWLGDTGGYFGGRFLGGKVFGDRKLAPRISPKKTWEGALGGLLLSVVGSCLMNLIFWQAFGSFLLVAKVAALGGIAGQLGDLVESTFKRFSGVKDSGTIFPGHGGFLDRVDGILFCAPTVWAILWYQLH